MMELTPYSIEQQRHVHEVRDLWTALAPLRVESRDLVGGMQWKTIRGREYLYRYAPDPVTKKKRSTSLGPRSTETEGIHRRFLDRRALLRDDLPRLETLAATQARVSKALRLGRLSRATGDFLNLLFTSGLSAHLMLIGPLAVHGYETVFLHEIQVPDAPALQFMLQDDTIAGELLAEMRQAMPDLAARHDRSGAIALTTGDTAFTVWSRTEWLRRLEERADSDQIACIGDRLAVDAMTTFAFDRSGRPAPMSVPDPIAYAMIAYMDEGAELELGRALVELAVDTGRFELEDHEIDAFPEIATRIGGFGPRI